MTPARRRIPGLLGAALVLALAACEPIAGPTVAPGQTAAAGSGAPIVVWPAPADPMGLTVKAGLVPETVEHLAYHVHAHLDVFVDGQPVLVPAGIGINIDDPEVHAFDDPGGTSYGGITGCAQPCISPLHTHNPSGIIHTESATPQPNTLGQFFTEWDVPLSATCVGTYCAPKAIAFYVDGVAYTGDPRAIELTNLREIAIVIGTPPAVIPATSDFSRP